MDSDEEDRSNAVSKANKVEPETTEAAESMDIDKIPLQQEKEEEEEDVVVREIDVYFNPSIDDNTKLYVLQYPLTPPWLDERCEEVRVNPLTSEVEIDLSMDVHSSNYVTKQTLKTTWKQPPTFDYAIGVLSGEELNLHPVHAVTQLRPSMQSTNQNPIPEKDWVSLRYHGHQSELSSAFREAMMATGNSPIDFNMSSDEYINSMCHVESTTNSEPKDSAERILTLPPEERVQKLLCQGPPTRSHQGQPLLFRYSVLKHYAPDLSDEDFLKLLQQYAWLVQGVWTPKTSLLKLDWILAFSRDYVLVLFSRGPCVTFSEVDATGVFKDDVKLVLSEYARERPLLKDWKLRFPTYDDSFIKSYPHIVEKQAKMWKVMDEFITLQLQTIKRFPDDLIMEIFSLLPVKSILRSRLVSTSWKSLLSSSLFIDSFRAKSEARPQLLFCIPGVEELNVYSSPQDKVSALLVTRRHRELPMSVPLTLRRPVNGLLCYKSTVKIDGFSGMIIANPNTGQWVPLPIGDLQWFMASVSLGYEAILKKFSLLYIRQNVDHHTMALEPEMLWKKIEGIDNFRHDWSEQLYINGTICYLGYHTGTDPQNGIMRFHVRDEHFSSIELPEGSDYLEKEAKLFNYKDKLALLLYGELTAETKSLDLWVLLDSKKPEWRKVECILPPLWVKLVGDLDETYCVVGVSGSEVIMAPRRVCIPLDLICFDVETASIRKIEIQGLEKHVEEKLYTYCNHMENLVEFVDYNRKCTGGDA